MKRLLSIAFMMLLPALLWAKITSQTVTPFLVTQSSTAMTIYNSGNNGGVMPGITCYIVGGATTTAATFEVGPSTINFKTVGGLQPGTTTLWFASYPTIGGLVAYVNAIDTTTVPGAEGGIVMTTVCINGDYVQSTALTEIAATACKGAAAVKTLTLTPIASQTCTYTIHTGSISFISTNGLYPGNTQISFASYPTLTLFAAYLNGLSSATVGVDGSLTAIIPAGIYEKNVTEELTAKSATSILTSTSTLYFDRMLGWTYNTGTSMPWGFQYHITGLNVNATFSSGTTYLHIYDGDSYDDTELLRYEIDTSATETPIHTIMNGDDFAGSKETAIRFDVIGSSWVSGGYMSGVGHKQ